MGARYEGEFLHGSKHGHGKYRSCTGVEYEGQFSNDEMHGEGRYHFADGRVYVGQCVSGHMSGVGRMDWPSGAYYEGGHLSGMKSGEGTFRWPDGRVFRGLASGQTGWSWCCNRHRREYRGRRVAEWLFCQAAVLNSPFRSVFNARIPPQPVMPCVSVLSRSLVRLSFVLWRGPSRSKRFE